VSLFEESLVVFQKLESESEEAATLSSLIQPLMYLGDYARAFDCAGRAKGIAVGRSDDLLAARVDINFGNILHRQDRFSEAVASYQAALDTLTRMGESRDCAVAFLNLAVCYISLNDFNAAEEAYRQARLLSEKEDMPRITAQADYNIAYLYYYRSRYGKAMELYQQTRLFCARSGDSFHSALCDLDQAEMYLDLRLHEEASELARQAQGAFALLSMPYEAAKAGVWLAVAAYQEGRLARALELLTEAREQMSREGNVAWTADLDLYRSLVLGQEGRYYEALRLCKRAQLAFAERGFKSVHADLVRAGLEVDLGRGNDAIQRLEKVLIQAERLQSPHLLFYAHLTIGRCREAQELPSDAMASYSRSLSYLEHMPVNAISEGFKISYRRDRLEVYGALVSLGTTGRMAAEAVLDIVEKARSREVADLVSFRVNTLKTTSRNKSSLVEQLQKLREELDWYYRQTQNAELADKAESGIRAADMRVSIGMREQCLLETLEAVRDTEAEFHSIQTAASIPINRIREVLMRNELFLEFFEARGVIYVALLTQETCQTFPLTRIALVREQLRTLNSHFANVESEVASQSTDFRSDKTLAIFRVLHEALIQPIWTHLADRRLIISSEGPLRYVPFHALFDGTHFLTERYVLSYAGSASLYYLGSKKARLESSRDVVVDTEARGWQQSLCLAGFSSVSNVEELCQQDNLRFLHLACQLSPRLDNPMLSTVMIGNGAKTVLDLFNLDLPCSLMSVTGVGSGVRANGDGKEFESVARALEYAGARTLLLPIWNGRSDPVQLFFESFYKEASANTDAPLAFQTALATVRNEFPDPYDWASFLVRGQTGRKGLSP
jgi:CHAT domain-containing protein